MLPPIGDADVLRDQFNLLDGLLLPGGADIAPSFYGADPHPEQDPADVHLDEAELTLARWALSEKKPVLGICRGQQVMNVAAGGTLYQDIPTEISAPLVHRSSERSALIHEITIETDSRLANLIGVTAVGVNSMHHQSVRELAAGFLISARSADAVIEAIELADHPYAIAVQFHPEELVPGHEASEKLFLSFIAAASANPAD
jgi:putative glutamine amidotransferase